MRRRITTYESVLDARPPASASATAINVYCSIDLYRNELAATQQRHDAP